MPPPIRTRDALIEALAEAAELEHSVTCQYLFAAFSMKKDPAEGGVTWPQLEHVREWQGSILLVARQEMEHLGLVCNLLTAVGGAPHFRRTNFPHPAPYCPDFEALELQPFGAEAMERFMHIEQVHGPEAAGAYGGCETIGGLYARIKEGFTYLDRNDGKLFIGPSEAQVTNGTLSLPPGWYDIDLVQVVDLETAHGVLDQVVEAGESVHTHRGDSHYDRFREVYEGLQRLRDEDPAFAPARPVVPNPCTRLEDHARGLTVLDDPLTRRAADLFNRAYEIMLLMLMRFYAPTDESAEERDGLKRIVFFPMMTMVIRPLGEVLTQMPACTDLPGRTAGPTFELHRSLSLPPFKQSAWIYLHEHLQEMARSGAELAEEVGRAPAPWAERIHPRLLFLQESLENIASNFERYMQLRAVYMRQLMRRLF